MFNNKFNSKKTDPLVEAVKQAQADGDMRRQAIATVNEQFGVYSRNAVIRENLAAYDAAIEEAYKNLKEGNKENKEKKKEHEEKTGMEHIKKMGGFPGQSLKRTARELTKEEKKLADKDYDKDGKVESPKDEVWGSRLRAAKMAGKLKEEEQIDELSKNTLGSYVGKAAAANYGKEKLEREKGVKLAMDKITGRYGVVKGTVKGKGTNEETDYSAQDRAPVTKSAPKEDPSLPKEYPGAASSAPTAARLSNAKAAVTPIKEEEQIDEISKELAGRYIKKADYKRSDSSFQSGKVYGKELATKRRTKQDVETARGHNRDAYKREKGINTAVNKLIGKAKVHAKEETQVDEAAYSAKAARAGKDIGKRGKNFEKIAQKAGEKYGSKERGEAVAGKILAKIRAKHMKEDQSF